MRFDPPHSIDHLGAHLDAFLDIADESRWWKRVDGLFGDGTRSPYLAKIVSDHHWLELELSTQINIWRDKGHLLLEQIHPQSMAALLFAGMVVETQLRLTQQGKNSLAGRVRDSLNTGFSSLYSELDIARGLLDEGYEVDFPDMDGHATYDLRFYRNGVVGEVECKSLSADAGRKIHRKDFYRFMDALGPYALSHADGTVRSILLITLKERMAADDGRRRALVAAAVLALDAPFDTEISGGDFMIVRKPYDMDIANSDDPYAVCSNAYGPNCHVAGVSTETGLCLVIVRSRREDDHSKPQLEGLKKAASQLSGRNPGVIAVQFEDIEPPDLALSHVRRRAGILANYVFHSQPHLAAVYHTAYDGLHATDAGLAKPAFVVWNPRCVHSTTNLPFRNGISNSEFARMLNVDLTRTDPDGEFVRLE